MSTLVTGGTGFIGSYIVRELDVRGEETLLLSYSGRPSLFNFSRGVKIAKGDIVNFNELFEICKNSEVKRIIHLAGYTTYLCQGNPYECLKVNSEGTLNILEVCRRLDVEKLIFASSVVVYGEIKNPKGGVKEDSPLKPVTLYAVTKLLGEVLGLNYLKNYGIDFGAFRITAAYGYSGILNSNRKAETLSEKCRFMVEASLKGLEVSIEKGGLVMVDWVHVEDCAWLMVQACLSKERLKHNIYNLGSGEAKNLFQLSKLVKRLIPNSKVRIVKERDPTYPFLGPVDISRAREDFSYKPRGIYEGLKTYIEFIKGTL